MELEEKKKLTKMADQQKPVATTQEASKAKKGGKPSFDNDKGKYGNPEKPTFRYTYYERAEKEKEPHVSKMYMFADKPQTRKMANGEEFSAVVPQTIFDDKTIDVTTCMHQCATFTLCCPCCGVNGKTTLYLTQEEAIYKHTGCSMCICASCCAGCADEETAIPYDLLAPLAVSKQSMCCWGVGVGNAMPTAGGGACCYCGCPGAQNRGGCCCCPTNASGMNTGLISPGCGCDKDAVMDIFEELKARQTGRGTVGTIQRLELLHEIVEARARGQRAPEYTNIPNQDKGMVGGAMAAIGV